MTGLVSADRTALVAEAEQLRAEGLTYQEIADRLGVASHATVYKWLHPAKAREWTRRDNARPEAKARKRAEERKPSEACPSCGRPRTRGQVRGGTLCQACRFDVMRDDHRKRDEQIVKWWNEDQLSMAEICARLGWSKGRLCGELYYRLPQRGYTIQPRYRRSRAP